MHAGSISQAKRLLLLGSIPYRLPYRQLIERFYLVLESLDPNSPGIQEVSKQLLGIGEWVSLGALKKIKTGRCGEQIKVYEDWTQARRDAVNCFYL
jgi:hypothetical protein